MASLRETVRDLLDRTDSDLLVRLYAGVSVSTARVRRRLRLARKPFVDPRHPPRPPARELDRTAAWVVGQSRFRLSLLGGVIGLGGLATMPTEIAATTVAALRLAQRLAVVYGFDPESDRGEMAVWRALAAGFEVELPGDGPLGVRVTDLPRVVAPGIRSHSAGGALAGAVVKSSAILVARRLTRFLPIPVVSSGASASAASRRMREVGGRMARTLRRLSEAPEADPELIRDAIEVD